MKSGECKDRTGRACHVCCSLDCEKSRTGVLRRRCVRQPRLQRRAVSCDSLASAGQGLAPLSFYLGSVGKRRRWKNTQANLNCSVCNGRHVATAAFRLGVFFEDSFVVLCREFVCVEQTSFVIAGESEGGYWVFVAARHFLWSSASNQLRVSKRRLRNS